MTPSKMRVIYIVFIDDVAIAKSSHFAPEENGHARFVRFLVNSDRDPFFQILRLAQNNFWLWYLHTAHMGDSTL